MSEEISGGDMSLHVPERVSENIHRVKPVNEDDSRDAREQFRDSQEEQKERETSERDAQDKSASEKPGVSVGHWESIHDDVILSETAQRLMDQSQPAESNHDRTDEKSPPAEVPRIHLTA
jgi:hypothetical protein